MTPSTVTTTAGKPRRPKLSTTERKLIEMLTENTGRSFLDSGDHYGRHWQQNQGLDFPSRPAATLEVRPCEWKDQKAEIDVTLDLFHWLRERLEYDAAMTAKYNRFANRRENKESPHLPLMEEFAKEVRHGTGLYGDGSPFTVNTYNGEDLLSQTIQYVFWQEGDRAFVLLQIHGGCDVRGGYTAPKVFEVTGHDETCIFDNARAYITEALPEHLADGRQTTLPGLPPAPIYPPNWYTDDAYHWYEDGGTAGRQLETYEVSFDPEDKGNGKIYVDADGVAYGPIYGGRLEIGSA
mgnify:CR=1 FL=1